MAKCNISHKINRPICTLRQCIIQIWDHILLCSLGKSVYRMLPHPEVVSSPTSSSPLPTIERRLESSDVMPTYHDYHYDSKDSDLVALKISLLGDCQIGKTSFLEKYVGNKKEDQGAYMQENGMNLMGKTLVVRGARISYCLWEVDGNQGSRHQVPVACKDSVAILIMFDLTSRVTLNGVIRWYQEARKWNQVYPQNASNLWMAIPIIVGTKFDEFIQLPIDLQWAIASQARAYAKALNATLFFSSAAYNINVNKIFKFITAKLFDLPWTVERNLTIGEPIIDF